MPRHFPVDAVISTYHDRMLCGFDEYRDLLDYMTGHDLMLYQIAHARRVAAKSLERQHPALKQLPKLPERIDHRNRHVKDAIKLLDRENLAVAPIGKYTPPTFKKMYGASR